MKIRKHFKDKVFETVIPRSVKLSESPSFGKPIILYDIESKGSEAYFRLAREVLVREREISLSSVSFRGESERQREENQISHQG